MFILDQNHINPHTAYCFNRIIRSHKTSQYQDELIVTEKHHIDFHFTSLARKNQENIKMNTQ